MKAQIDELFRSQMTRKEFVQHVGAAFLILIGVGGVIKALLGTQAKPKLGYGSSAYGGTRRS